MDAAVLHTFGEPPIFSQFPDPVPGQEEELIRVGASALTPIARWMAELPAYAGKRELPFVAGLEGVGTLPDGRRVAFAVRRPPYGSMSEWTVAPRAKLFSVPDNVDDVAAAAVFHPGLTAWLSLAWRARLAPGETVLVLGGTGVAGRVAIQVAKLLGAARVVAAGRNAETLATLADYGADGVIDLTRPSDELAAAFRREGLGTGYHVVLDYLWGRPVEALLDALPKALFTASDVRLVQLGSEAGFDATVNSNGLRRAGVTLLGSVGDPPPEYVTDVYRRLLTHTGAGDIRVPLRAMPLADVEKAWQSEDRGHRLVFTP
ncbi:quinone oxidoreductase family protein [Amycolatopsis sp. NPDC004747]